MLADLRRRLDAGEFADVFPGELVLVNEYGVSRHTVREALRRLRGEGLVVAERGRAPRLAGAVEIEQPIGALYSLFASVEAAGLRQHSVVRTLDARADGVVAVRLGLEESTPLLYLERLRLADDEPLAVDRVWLPARLAAPLLDVDFSHTARYTELSRRCGISRSSSWWPRSSAYAPWPAEHPATGASPCSRAASQYRKPPADDLVTGAVDRLRHRGQPGQRLTAVLTALHHLDDPRSTALVPA